jgi:hypothetical protein
MRQLIQVFVHLPVAALSGRGVLEGRKGGRRLRQESPGKGDDPGWTSRKPTPKARERDEQEAERRPEAVRRLSYLESTPDDAWAAAAGRRTAIKASRF